MCVYGTTLCRGRTGCSGWAWEPIYIHPPWTWRREGKVRGGKIRKLDRMGRGARCGRSIEKTRAVSLAACLLPIVGRRIAPSDGREVMVGDRVVYYPLVRTESYAGTCSANHVAGERAAAAGAHGGIDTGVSWPTRSIHPSVDDDERRRKTTACDGRRRRAVRPAGPIGPAVAFVLHVRTVSYSTY